MPESIHQCVRCAPAFVVLCQPNPQVRFTRDDDLAPFLSAPHLDGVPQPRVFACYPEQKGWVLRQHPTPEGQLDGPVHFCPCAGAEQDIGTRLAASLALGPAQLPGYARKHSSPVGGICLELVAGHVEVCIGMLPITGVMWARMHTRT